jgi:NAD(P)-dependent dehydrogenase (short-subunit alcohol dehydrogenase family)
MVAAGSGGTIVNVSSGNQCGHKDLVTYGATKGAVSTLTYGWARELEEHGIRVNAISPNAHTGQIDQAIAHYGHNPEHAVLPEPADNAAIVTYLLSDLSHKLNGQIVRLEHGFLNVMGHPVAVHPRVAMGEWTVETVAWAFADTLDEHLQPAGLSEAELRHVQFLL